MNSVNIIGNLCRDPEIRYLPNGTAVCNLSLAVNESYKEEKIVSFFDVEAWSKIAESCHQYLSKGSKVGVSGALKQYRWEKDDQKRSKVMIRAIRVEFLNTKPKDIGEEEPGIGIGEDES